MLQITIPAPELWDEKNEKFVHPIKEQTLRLEHSLVSLSKWESKWCKPFLTKKEKTNEETLDYIKCMTLTQNVDPEIYKYLTDDNVSKIKDYIYAPMTATTFSEEKNGKSNREIITTERIYGWMIKFNIPVEFEKWHINRLLTLIRVCSIDNQPSKKKRKVNAVDQASLNASRMKKLNTRG